MEIKAELNYLHIAPRKVRLVVGLLRGMSVRRAELELGVLPKRSALPLRKLLQSAVASAKHNFQLTGDTLFIKSILVNEGPVLKRMRPRAFGRGATIRKKMSHVLLTLDTREELPSSRKGKKVAEGPMVRDITAADVKEILPESVKTEKNPQESVRVRRKPVDFVRRVFRRKAI